ncbi:PspC domain-containing protein [Mesonia maritima]|uniref:Phage shock protein PspC (Stress-responsive transcriptional regulator) n=1 Tax=Mesonia maritima TaxID=1793873 RepID=A0ABU1K5I3_9FLAO|nr:PspC domain-containing protein [Mesonia maritima]MDR6300873.1 phage shock protein PspC (stress-responsive transcriptional regulator) [Mesonia maritima]
MNKTVNINLAGIFFHIDEDAFLKLKSYLDAIKHSFTDAQGRDEIIHDIEARIAELFTEKIENERQVVTIKEVEAVIDIMGQPEDYKVDDDIFEDDFTQQEPTAKNRPKKLYRDTDHSYIAGVSSGLGHFFKIDAIWVRILFILFTIATTGGFIFIYLLFWIFVPEATTTAEKLEMRGEPINISNIERKVREGFDNVTGKVKDVDYKKYGDKVTNGAGGFFKTLGNFILTLLKIFVKFIGILILLFAGSGLISLVFGILSVGTFGIFEASWIDYVELANIGVPFWLACLLLFFAAGIPLFFLFILGLKILVNNLRSIGNPVKFVLLGIWLVSIFVISFLGIRQASERAFDGHETISKELPISVNDTLFVKMRGSDYFGESERRSSDLKIRHTQDGEKIIYSNDIRLIVKSTRESFASVEITKSAEGKSDQAARKFAEEIAYHINFNENTLSLDDFFTTPAENSFRDQEVEITLFLPVGSTLFANENTYSYHRNYDSYNDILENGQEEHYLEILHQGIKCNDCPVEDEKDFFNENSDTEIIQKKVEVIDSTTINTNEESENDSDWYQKPTQDSIPKNIQKIQSKIK